MIMRKLFAFLLAFVMLFSLVALMASCDNESDVGDDSSSDGTTSGTPGEGDQAYYDDLSYEDRQQYQDTIPELDYTGQTIHILSQELVKEMIVMDPDLTEDAVDTAVYERMLAISERFKCDIDVFEAHFTLVGGLVNKMASSGADEYQIVLGQTCQTAKDIVNSPSNYLDLNELPYCDFTKPWWSPLAYEQMNIGNKVYMMVGDFDQSNIFMTYCMFFNKQLAENYKINDLYEVVQNGDWTIDYLTTLVKDIYDDADYNNEPSSGDIFGYGGNLSSPLNAFLWSFDVPIVEITEDNEAEILFNNEKTVTTLNKLWALYKETPGTFCIGEYDDTHKTMFNNGQILLTAGVFRDLILQYRNMEDEIGILPYPKFDKNQDTYYTMVDGGHSALTVPASCEDLEFTSAIIEALASYGWKNIAPVYYEEALKIKQTRDEESKVMLDLIMDGRRFDFSILYDGFQGFAFVPEYMFARNNSNDFASYYESYYRSAQLYYDSVVAALTGQ